MQRQPRFSAFALASSLLAAVSSNVSASVAAIAANTFFDPHALALERRRALEGMSNPAPIPCPSLLRDNVFRSGARAHLKTARRDYFADLRELGGTPATRSDEGVPAIMNRAARRAAARALRYSV